MRIGYSNLKLKQSEIANQLGYLTSTLQRYRSDIKMLSPYRINPNNTNKRTKKPSNTHSENNSRPDSDVKRPQMTSIDLVKAETNTKFKRRNKLKGGDSSGSQNDGRNLSEQALLYN